jgi:hypothetical protein
MALLEIDWNPGRRELKQFALLWTGFFGLIGAYGLVRHGSATAAIVFGILAALGALGYFLPGALRPVYILWMALAFPIGWLVSHLLLLMVYYLAITPIGLVMRLTGHDPLQRRLDRAAESYWTPHDAGDAPARYFKQY